MSEHGLTQANILQSLPIALQGDPSVVALATATAEELAKRPAEIDLARIYADIDRLPEAVLDILAYDFKVDWWDGDYTLEQKRQTFKDSFMVHKRLGTKWAVETAMQTVFPGGTASEWFEYENGKPYHFKTDVPINGPSPTYQQQMRGIGRVWWYKNLRSHWDSIEYHVVPRESIIGLAHLPAVQVRMVVPEQPDDLAATSTTRTGGRVGSLVYMTIPEEGE